MASVLRWPRSKLASSSKTLPPTPNIDDETGIPPTPGYKRSPPSIGQLAMPSPDESSSSSNTSHDPTPVSDNLEKYNVASPRSPKRLRKAPPPPPPSSYPFSFIAENPPQNPNFPYSFSTPASPSASVTSGSARAFSMLPRVARKLTKRRPSSSEASTESVAELVPPTVQRRNTFNFSLRRKKTSTKGTQSEDGHSSLPSLPPPSPLAVNVPTFLPFHARRRDSWHVPSASESHHHSTPPTTDSLSELAWTGIASQDLVISRHRSGWRSTWSLTDPEATSHNRSKPRFTIGDETDSPLAASPILNSRPPLIRRDAVTASPKRRWTLAMALTDDGISDELLVEKLEALRSRSRAGSFTTSDVDDPDDWERVWAVCNDELDIPAPPVPPKDAVVRPPLPSPSSMPALPTQPLPATPSWQSARRALLTCRELVRTERHFLSSLQSLLVGETRQPPPPLMRAYASTLAKESAKLLRRFEDDPSAWGCAAALLGAEETLEAAFVAWCGVVGGWFVDSAEPRYSRRLSKSRLRVSSDPGVDEDEPVPAKGARSKPASWRHSSAGPTTRPSSFLSLNMTLTAEPTQSSPLAGRSRPRRDARPAVRDLAILPTQRVMRYVLLYRDLLEHTPTRSPARALVAQAVDVSVRMAQRCDRAQGNAAFLQSAA
ncbi:DH domain-containing protein [Mycena indigotica]|uniref:DH domain-containing protein n=1 Tax=Mycena indigotica TaxID=2126181 RepID=A0A8H6T0F8_9AGAR|nr:DH domain-containing protein [Mycena indigotica]KAF7307195.1 DH domain-containing protein [Mycena indigotica]